MNYTVSLRKRNDVWSYQIFVDGVYYSSKSGFETKRDAKRAGDNVAIKIKNPKKSKDTFKTVAELYIADRPREQSTIATYEKWLNVFKPIHNIEMLKLSYDDVSPVINEYSVTHKYNGSKSMLGFGKAIVNFAIEKLDYDMRNPFIKIKIDKKSENSKKEHQILTMDEMLVLFDKIDDPDIRFLSMCFGLAGMRISEARGLTFKSFAKDTVSVLQQRQTVRKKIAIKKNTKSHNGIRKIPLDPNLAIEFKKIPINLNKDSLIVDTYYSSDQVIKRYKKLGYEITPHSLRHAYSTYCIQMGIDFKTLSELIGDSLEVTMSTYAHVNTDMMDYAKKVLTNSMTK